MRHTADSMYSSGQADPLCDHWSYCFTYRSGRPYVSTDTRGFKIHQTSNSLQRRDPRCGEVSGGYRLAIVDAVVESTATRRNKRQEAKHDPGCCTAP